MPDDLIIKFFREDLTEAEETALSEMLSSSVEDALRLGQHAETSYYHYGLPEPRWPGSPPPPGFPRAGGGLKTWFPIVLLAGLLGWAGWKYISWSTGASKASMTTLVSSPAPPAPKPNANPEVSSPPSPASKAPEVSSASQPSASGGSTPAFPPTSLNPATSAVTPVNLGGQTRQTHTNLEVVVHQKKTGLVSVQVLNPEGMQVVLLYDGMLQPGSWAFDWNGLLADGSAPPPGTYQIQVQSGTATLSKKIKLKKQP